MSVTDLAAHVPGHRRPTADIAVHAVDTVRALDKVHALDAGEAV